MTDEKDALKSLLQKLLPTRGGGTSYETKDREFGHPARYLCTMTWDEREAVAELIRFRIAALEADGGDDV